MRSRITSLGLPAALLSASLFAACQNTTRGVEEDTERNTAEMREEAREAGNAAERAGDRVGESAERMGDRVAGEGREATATAGSAIDAAAQTMQIKTALIDADNVDADDINVDTSGDMKTVTLKGHVPSAAQKAAAERIAREHAPDYRIVNNLEIRR